LQRHLSKVSVLLRFSQSKEIEQGEVNDWLTLLVTTQGIV